MFIAFSGDFQFGLTETCFWRMSERGGEHTECTVLHFFHKDLIQFFLNILITSLFIITHHHYHLYYYIYEIDFKIDLNYNVCKMITFSLLITYFQTEKSILNVVIVIFKHSHPPDSIYQQP